MTIHEAIEQLKSLLDHCKTMRESGEVWVRDCEALDVALAALRGPTRDQVEALPKCDYCEAEWGTCDPITNRFTMPPRGGIRFCPMCGRPITDDAVDIMLKRLEVMKDENRTD